MLHPLVEKNFPVSLIFYLAVAFFLFYGFNTIVETLFKPVNCDSFISWRHAQFVYSLNPEKYKRLDRDHDKKACEHMIHG